MSFDEHDFEFGNLILIVRLVPCHSYKKHSLTCVRCTTKGEQYVMKQQGHSLDMTCVAYSPDGLYVVTGGYDGKVKVWDSTSGFCLVTFSEHKSTVTGLVFSANKRFLVSSSLDGTVRCYDLTR